MAYSLDRSVRDSKIVPGHSEPSVFQCGLAGSIICIKTAELSSTDALQVLNHVAGGRDVSANVRLICQTLIRGPAAPLVKRLAYDVVHAAPLSDADWALVVEGIRSDMMGTFSMEVSPITHCAHHSLNILVECISVERISVHIRHNGS